MRRDMNVGTSKTRAGVELQLVDETGAGHVKDRLTQWTQLLGFDSDAARAELFGVTPRTIRRARDGIIGEKLMANSVLALKQYERELARYGLRVSLDELYRVVEKAA